jgi:hypothetical protein
VVCGFMLCIAPKSSSASPACHRNLPPREGSCQHRPQTWKQTHTTLLGRCRLQHSDRIQRPASEPDHTRCAAQLQLKICWQKIERVCRQVLTAGLSAVCWGSQSTSQVSRRVFLQSTLVLLLLGSRISTQTVQHKRSPEHRGVEALLVAATAAVAAAPPEQERQQCLILVQSR